jgi:hypothetical protein
VTRAGRLPASFEGEGTVNHIPMRTGVRVKQHDVGETGFVNRTGEIGTTIDRTEDGQVLVQFADGVALLFPEADLTTTL